MNQDLKTSASPTFTGGTYTSNLGVSGSLTVKGMVTAEEFHTEFVSASIVYKSGSTKFGDDIDDTHSFTGSINQSGSFNLNDGNLVVADNIDLEGDIDVNGTSNLDIVDIDGAVNMAADLTMGANILMADDTSIGIADDAERIEFDGAGDISVLGANFGIGTTSPADELHIEASVPGLRLVDTGNDATAQIGYSDTSGFFLRLPDDANNEDVIIRSYGDTVFNGGNVGIGTASPDHKLTVKSDNNTNLDPTITVLSNNETVSSSLAYNGINASGEFIVRVGGATDAISIDSSGNATFAGDIDIDVNDDLRLRFLNGTFKGGIQVPTTIGDMISGSAVDDLAIRSQANMLFSTGGNTERMRIDSSGNVGIGDTSTGTYKLVVDSGTAGNSNAEAGIFVDGTRSGVVFNLVSNSANTSVGTGTGIKFKSGGFTTGAIITRSTGTAASGDAPGYMTFHTSTDDSEDLAERMRIDSSGNLLVNKTALEYDSNVGHVIRADGLHSAIRSGGNVTDFNRLSSEGEISRFSYDGTTVGSIGVNSTDNLYFAGVAGSTKGIYLSDTGVLPADTGGAPLDNGANLGHASYRWANLYVADIQLSNEGNPNEVDGTEGSWTIQEGEDDLFLLNRKNGKKYKFKLEVV